MPGKEGIACMLKKLLPSLKEYKLSAILSPVAVVAESVIEIFIPFLMSKIINVGLYGEGGLSYIIQMGLLMLAMSFAALGCGCVAARASAVASTGFAASVRRRLFHKIQDFSFANIDKFSTSSLVTRLTTDITYLQLSCMMALRMLVRAPTMLVISTIFAARINRELSVVFLIAVPVLAVVLAVIMTKAFPRFTAMFEKYDRMNADVQENLVGIRVVKAFVRGKYENEKFDHAATDIQNAQKRAEKLAIVNMPVFQLVMYTCMILVSWLGGKQILAGTMLTGDLMSFISYVTQILMSLMMLSMTLVTLVISRASMKRVCEVLDEQLDVTDENADESLHPADGSVDFDHVSFGYNKRKDNYVLQDIDLHIRSGERIGIIGGTGSSKSSLVQLIPRLYDVLEGQVLVGGRDVRDYKLKNLRDDVAMVLQKNVLFSGTIRENMRWGDEDATDEEIEAACKTAQAHDFIMSFPKGYDTDLGQGGVNVSGGQKQRLCIARAILKKPKIMILDDSTSAVDTATDSKIRAGLRAQMADMTVLIIAQRINSVMECDRIVLINDGKIVDVGSHAELLARSEIYKEIYESQQKGVA